MIRNNHKHLSLLVSCIVLFTASGVMNLAAAQTLREVCDRPNFSFQMFPFYQRVDMNEDGEVDFLIGTLGSSDAEYDDKGNRLRSYSSTFYKILPCGENMVRRNHANVYVLEPGESVDADTVNSGGWYGSSLTILGRGGWSDGTGKE